VRLKPSIKPALVFLLLFVFARGLAAQTGTAGNRGIVFPRIEPDSLALEYARKAQDGGYSPMDLAEISFWASGGSLSGRASYMEQIRTAADEMGLSPDFPEPERDRAEYLLAFIHKKFLKTYSHHQTRIDTLLANGRYNCVSSAVLYMVFALYAGLDVSGVMTKDHAFVTVRIGGDSIDVETTNSWGFDPGKRREFHDQFGKLTGFAYVPARNYRERTAISPIELVSLIFSNRISELESGRRFSEAVPLAVDRAALLANVSNGAAPGGVNTGDSPDLLFENPRREMMNRIFNYGAFLLNSGKEDDCLGWAEFASPRYPDEKRWQEFVMTAVNNRIQKLAKAGQFAAAREFLERQKTRVSPENYALLDSMLADTELFSGASKIRGAAEGDRILAAIEQARAGRQIDEKRAQELAVFAVQKTAAALSAAPRRDWLAAIDYIEKALARFGAIRELETSLHNYRTNRAVDFHNRFASAWNKRNYGEAERILNEGLTEFPDNKQLLADKKMTESR
jgi:tetratricopeptide (TPR) repeat protein